jgi:hypothetical protein
MGWYLYIKEGNLSFAVELLDVFHGGGQTAGACIDILLIGVMTRHKVLQRRRVKEMCFAGEAVRGNRRGSVGECTME